ncbi:MAG: YbhB/YbcL family Raf kinase inhibitor-like protein [Caldisericia bacterium]|nr:YbhB/YbcL family Raf kinase inhibitor-like protein [Caldisericia bacterium]
MKKIIILIIFILLIFVGCSKKETKEYEKITLKSSILKENELIPEKYSCDGEDISPPLEWENIPQGTKSFCIIMEDPDAPGGIFTHWIIFNIPSNYMSLPENFPKIGEFENGIKQGKNDFNKIGYNGPCPPKNSTHHYRFKIFSLDTILNLNSGIKVNELMKAIENHILGIGELICIYKH